MNVLVSMAAFALVASITPGPVNIVALASGARFGFLRSQGHVLGATLGFVCLLLVTGFGLRELLAQWPLLVELVRWAGVLFLLHLAWKLASDNGQLGAEAATPSPSFWRGAAIQWLNPKAWLAAVAGIGALVGDGQAWLIWSFAAIYFLVCYLSVTCWVYAGAYLAAHLRSPGRVRLFNRCMAAVLGGCALSLLHG